MKHLAAVFALMLAAGCSKGSPTAPSPPAPINPPAGNRTVVLVGAGDIGMCGSAGTVATGRLIQETLGDVFLAGDIAYPHGSAANFAQCFDPYWGHARDRWHPVPGNHEYESPNAMAYFDYFEEAAGPRGRGYYAFNYGEWLVLMLDSNIAARRDSLQYEFVRTVLMSQRPRCTLAIWHHPLFSSGPNGPGTFMRDMWQLLYDNDADVIINGHDHLYERFSRQDADGRGDGARGIRQFTVGTGGAQLSPFVTVAPNSTTRISTFGILKITLRPDAYDWEFLQTVGGLGDNGFTSCH